MSKHHLRKGLCEAQASLGPRDLSEVTDFPETHSQSSLTGTQLGGSRAQPGAQLVTGQYGWLTRFLVSPSRWPLAGRGAGAEYASRRAARRVAQEVRALGREDRKSVNYTAVRATKGVSMSKRWEDLVLFVLGLQIPRALLNWPHSGSLVGTWGSWMVQC